MSVIIMHILFFNVNDNTCTDTDDGGEKNWASNYIVEW